MIEEYIEYEDEFDYSEMIGDDFVVTYEEGICIELARLPAKKATKCYKCNKKIKKGELYYVELPGSDQEVEYDQLKKEQKAFEKEGVIEYCIPCAEKVRTQRLTEGDRVSRKDW